VAHTFDIRFARSAGLAALLEAPANRFRWKGGGQIRIDPQGVSIAAKRGLLSLFASTRRIAAAELTEVYREGDALRLEFSTAGAGREVMPFWVKDRDTAARIVKLLPTQRTIELDDAPRHPRFRLDPRPLMLLGAVAIAGLAIAWLVRDGTSAEIALPAAAVTDYRAPVVATEPVLVPIPVAVPVHVPAASRPSRSREPGTYAQPVSDATRRESGEVTRASRRTNAFSDETAQALVHDLTQAGIRGDSYRPAARVRATDGIVPIVPGQFAYDAARRQLEWFEVQLKAVRNHEIDWWDVEVAIYNSEEMGNRDLWPLLQAELAASRAWRIHDQAFAEQLTARVRLYVR
jgi:hypothetical protein